MANKVPPLKTGPWKLAELKSVKKHGLKVFSCFHCGGGSTMGYKLAGFDVLGGVEIDPEMMEIYRENHQPKHSFLMGVQQFKDLPTAKIPKELFDLDILDGSPPCSSFSMNGSRAKGWGEKKKFREGQTEQVLDDLFFDFIAIAKKLQPKVVISENVKGLILGDARGYVKEIFQAFSDAGYETQLFLLNASAMGVPQRRERVFFISRKKSLKLPPVKMKFQEPVIPFKAIKQPGVQKSDLTVWCRKMWECRNLKDRNYGSITERMQGKATNYSTGLIRDNEVPPTLTAKVNHVLYSEPRHLTVQEQIRIQTFPDDYNFKELQPAYACGMSVPPFMMQRVASAVAEQMFFGGK